MTKDPVLQSLLDGISPYRQKIREIYLFGSRARGDERPDSDYDLLIVTREKDRELKDKIYDVITDICLSSTRDVSLKFFTEAEFSRLRSIPSRFIHNVLTEGIRLG